ncbi:MAG TPA: porin, partial [Gemmata sp.]|nr:porin [Gemmata sp.]
MITIPVAPERPAVPPAAPAVSAPVAPPASPAHRPAVQELPPPKILPPPQVVPGPREEPAAPTVAIPPVPEGPSAAVAEPPMPLAPTGPTPEQPPAKKDDAAAKKDDASALPPVPMHFYQQPQPRPQLRHKGLVDSLHRDDNYGLKSLFDSLHPQGEKGKHWYEKLSLRGYTQFRFARTVAQSQFGADPSLLGDRSINGNAENFSIRRARFILFGDVSDHLGIYVQPDFAVTPPGSTSNTFFGQLRDLYADVYVDTTKIHRFRVGLSKVPYGWENMQSSQNRLPLDRTDPINTGVSPNERDLGVFYYWTPVEKQQLLRDLVDGGLKGSGNYGIFGFGAYNGQGGSQLEQNLNLHLVARVTYPFQLPNGQVVEGSLQGYTGEIVVPGADIRPLGAGDAITPEGTGGRKGFRDQRLAATFVWYPQPFGFQAEWNYGEGPGLNDEQTAVTVRPLNGGYAMVMYKLDTARCGIITPYCRYQHYRGGYRAVPNAPYGTHDEWNLGVEWQIRK